MINTGNYPVEEYELKLIEEKITQAINNKDIAALFECYEFQVLQSKVWLCRRK